MERTSIPDGHNQNGAHVVEDGEGQKKQTKTGRAARAEQCQRAHYERRVGRHDGSPPVYTGLAHHEREVERGGGEHASKCAGK